MTRATTANVARALDRARRAAQAAGVADADRWTVQAGSPTYGRSWRLHVRDPRTGGLHSVIGSDGYLGATAREAAHALDMIATGLRLTAA